MSIASCRVFRLSNNASDEKLALPKRTCTMPALSALNSSFPALNSLMALSISFVTVPALGLGIRPLGPNTLPNLATFGIISGVAINKSKSIFPLFISSTKSSSPNKSAPAVLALATFSPLVITAIFIVWPVPLGSATVVLNCWSVYLGSIPKRM